MAQGLSLFSSALWGAPMITLLLFAHIFTTIKTGFIQKKLLTGIRLSVSKDESSGGEISQFQALTTALASTIGTGNIIGAASAVALGGAGAVFWCLVTGVLGMATKYAETILAVKYRVKKKSGGISGGAMYVLERGLNMRFVAVAFALFTIVAALATGCSIQSNAISSIITQATRGFFSGSFTMFGLDISYVSLVCSVLTAALTGFVIFKGLKGLSSVCEKLVPVMAGAYILCCIYILFLNRDYLLDSIALIVKSAFSTRAAAGGFVASTIMLSCRYGMSRGLFSNEAGMGSSPIVSACAQTKNSVRASLVSMSAVFWDTIVVLSLSGLVFVSTIIRYPSVGNTTNGAVLAGDAFAKIPYVGTPLLIFSLVTFAFSTLISWSYYGEKCIEYLTSSNRYIPFYRGVWTAVTAISAILPLEMIWNTADIAAALMAIPNLFSVLMLSGTVKSETKRYINNLDDADAEKIPIIS